MTLSCSDVALMLVTVSDPGLVIHKLQEVSIGNFIPHPATVVSISLTSLRTETGRYPRVVPCSFCIFRSNTFVTSDLAWKHKTALS